MLSVEYPAVTDWLSAVSDMTPLHIAAYLRDVTAIQSLLSQGINPHVSLLSGVPRPPLTIARASSPLSPTCPVAVRLLRKASLPWCPSSHLLYGPHARRYVYLIMMVRQMLVRQAAEQSDESDSNNPSHLPLEIWLHIASHVGRPSESPASTSPPLLTLL